MMKKVNFTKVYSYLAQTAFFLVLATVIKNLAMYALNNNLLKSNMVFELFLVRNRGAAFSILSTYTDILIVLSIIVLCSLLFYVIKHSTKLGHGTITTFSILTGGIIGNLYERIMDGFVTDYIKLNFIDFPVFNTSDILITIGAIGLIIALYKNK